jgi:hypothetical protein
VEEEADAGRDAEPLAKEKVIENYQKYAKEEVR